MGSLTRSWVVVAIGAVLFGCSSEAASPNDASARIEAAAADQALADVTGGELSEDAPRADQALDQQLGERGPDLALPGTKQMGEHCLESIECEEGICAAGEYTSAHCTPLCTDDAPCVDEANNVSGICTPVGGLNQSICIFLCGFLANGADCPGDLVCQGGAACR